MVVDDSERSSGVIRLLWLFVVIGVLGLEVVDGVDVRYWLDATDLFKSDSIVADSGDEDCASRKAATLDSLPDSYDLLKQSDCSNLIREYFPDSGSCCGVN